MRTRNPNVSPYVIAAMDEAITRTAARLVRRGQPELAERILTDWALESSPARAPRLFTAVRGDNTIALPCMRVPPITFAPPHRFTGPRPAPRRTITVSLGGTR